ncbi:hypothetical protein GCM10009798_37810 [Nocardioides panacihumi]|jgi:hypothetical protein|uniref:Uncharacterized protein n=1 Tax=Nocardioides panacihumi TaxID=400774 RepID=A0ABN2RQY9_9ACTN
MSPLILGFRLLPESLLHSEAYLVLVTFVSVNTVAFAALSIAKLLPPIRVAGWFTSRDRRAETRSIYPDAKP